MRGNVQFKPMKCTHLRWVIVVLFFKPLRISARLSSCNLFPDMLPGMSKNMCLCSLLQGF